MKLIKAEVVTIGDEILYGQITDTNTQFISAELDKIGIRTSRKISIGDNREDILHMLEDSTGRADIVLITGGLGPTKDDITKKTIADFTMDTLERRESAMEALRAIFDKFGKELTEINKKQADLPTKCTYLFNAVGTAPGMWFEHNGSIIVSMPGVPYEMKYLMQNEVIPRLMKAFERPVILHRIIRTVGIGESWLATKIESWEDQLPEHIKLAYLPNLSQVRLRLTGTGSDEQTLKAEIDKEVEKLYPLIAEHIHGEGEEELELTIAKLLSTKKATLATAESCTGGFLAHSITSHAGSSEYFLGTVVSYSNQAKMDLLGVKEETLEAYGAVSEQTVIEMAEGARKALKSNYAIGTSGIAGPGGGSEEKPVGTIWIAIAGPDKTVTQLITSTKDRINNIKYGSKVALNLLRKVILNEI
ncbi:competence/damage-inducible protein A [Jiulongibacter sediminis]|jgi:nicotinamide-nucleotide amidase|uniref:competence/damage-inducible protein A n=1 Tax=Jiulongibacter sediminis TaxID=1605367 RepID=UPI0026F038F1|nr:competence/damage-inducible protein A [Jiulongibacter sediminis]